MELITNALLGQVTLSCSLSQVFFLVEGAHDVQVGVATGVLIQDIAANAADHVLEALEVLLSALDVGQEHLDRVILEFEGVLL